MMMLEISLVKDIIQTQDLESILDSLSFNEEVTLRFDEKKGDLSSIKRLEPVFLKIVEKSKLVVLVGPLYCADLVLKADPRKAKFILHSVFNPNPMINTDLELVVCEMVEKFWCTYFKKLSNNSNLTGINFISHAEVKLENKELNYLLVFSFDERGLELSVENILQISMEGLDFDVKELSAEVLNMLCGHLRPVFKKSIGDVVIGIPIYARRTGPSHDLKLLRRWDYQLEIYGCVEIKLYRWV